MFGLGMLAGMVVGGIATLVIMSICIVGGRAEGAHHVEDRDSNN